MPMNRENFSSVRQEIERLLERLDRVEKHTGPYGYDQCSDITATGALRRASMDLTRALAELRGPY